MRAVTIDHLQEVVRTLAVSLKYKEVPAHCTYVDYENVFGRIFLPGDDVFSMPSYNLRRSLCLGLFLSRPSDKAKLTSVSIRQVEL